MFEATHRAFVKIAVETKQCDIQPLVSNPWKSVLKPAFDQKHILNRNLKIDKILKHPVDGMNGNSGRNQSLLQWKCFIVRYGPYARLLIIMFPGQRYTGK